MKRINKRGQIQDYVLIIVVLFMFAVATYIGAIIIDEFDDSNFTSSQVGNDTIASGVALFESFDSLFLYAFVFLGFATIASALFIRTHPLFFFIGGLLIIVFVLIIASGFNDAFAEVQSDPEFDEIRSDYGIMNHIFSNLEIYILVFFGLMIIALWGKGILGASGA